MAIPNEVLVSNAGLTPVNGIFTRGADINGFAAWYSNRTNSPMGVGFIIISQWLIGGGPNFGKYQIEIRDTALQYYGSTFSDTLIESPVGLTYTVNSGSLPVPIVTAVGNTEPTFGLPADVVALITSRFGSVANFLRLRNQGQV